MNTKSELRIGTSGWHYKHWRNAFYPPGLPAGEMFSWYSRHFNTVEINNTFYRLPTEDAVVNWRKIAPPNFVFSVKASRFITHMKRLLDPKTSSDKFFEKAKLLGQTLGPILFQLPPGWKINIGRLEEFIEALPGGYQYVFEFRDSTWATDSVYTLLKRYNAAMCIHDWQGVSWPQQITADFTYVRFHGPTGTYSGSYSEDVLAGWADQIKQWRRLRQVWVYFNNDIGGHAITNAMSLKTLLGSAPP